GGHDHQFHLIYPRVSEAGLIDDSFIKGLPENFRRAEISSFSLPSRFRMGSRVLNALARAIGRAKAEVYHSFTPEVPRIRTCPVVPTIHDLSFELDPVVRRTTPGRMLHRVTSRCVQYAARIVSVSSQTKYDIASIYRIPP